ncbi:hypothetical protein ABPG75_012424 [Micractinium tetrahymenae]
MAAPSKAQPQTQQEGEKELRGNIRGLLNRARHDRHNLISVDNNTIVKLVEESNEYVDKVTKPRDQAVDAEFFSCVTDAGLEFVSRLKQGGRAYSAGDFLRRLKARHVGDLDAQTAGADDPEAFNWAELGQLAAVRRLFCTAPVVHHMLGPLDAQPRQKRQINRQARRRLPTGDAVRPEEVDNLADQEKQETDRNMEEMWRVLTAHGDKVPLLDLVLNCDSFAQTTENLFTLSFLVRDSRVALLPDEEEGILVQKLAKAKNDPKEKSAREQERMQFVIPLDMETWELWKQAVGTNRPPLMKHRREWHQQAAAEAAAAAQAAAAAAGQQEEQQEQEQQEEAERPRQRRRQQPEAEEAPQQEQQQQQQQEQQPAPKRRKSRSQLQQQSEEAGADEAEEAEAPAPAKQQQPRGKRQQSAQPSGGGNEENSPPPAKRRQGRGTQQAQQPAVKQERPTPRVKQERPAPRVEQELAAPQPAAQQAQQDDVIVISDSEVVIPDSEDVIVLSDSDDVVSPKAAPVQQAQQAQQTQQGTQGSGRRAPTRGKR